MTDGGNWLSHGRRAEAGVLGVISVIRARRNVYLREALVELARQKPRYGYRRLHALLERRDHPASVMRIYPLYRAEGLAVRRLKRKRLSRVAAVTHVVRSNQEWALDFVCDTRATGRGIRVLAVVDAFTRGNLSLEVDTSLSSRRVTRSLEGVIERRGKPEAIRCDNVLNASDIFKKRRTGCVARVRPRSAVNWFASRATFPVAPTFFRTPLNIMNTRSAPEASLHCA